MSGGKKCAASLFIQPQSSLKHAAAQCHAWHCRRDSALLHDLLSNCHKRKSRGYLLLHQAGGKEQSIGKGAAQATQPVGSPAVIKYQCRPPLQPSRRGRCADKSRGIKINQVLIARPQRDCRRYQQYLQMRKNSEVILKHPKLPVQTEKQERSVIKAFLQWLYTVFSHH